MPRKKLGTNKTILKITTTNRNCFFARSFVLRVIVPKISQLIKGDMLQITKTKRS